MARQRRVTEPLDTLYGQITSYDKIVSRLDQGEQRGRRWVFARSRRTRASVPRDHDVLDMHRAMFGDLFAWAGTTRVEDRGPGGRVPVPWQHVRVALRQFADDLHVWVRLTGRNPALAEVASVVARAHHRFQWIHPFHDTNGRTGRVLDHYLLWVTYGMVGHTFPSTRAIEYAPTARVEDDYYNGLEAADRHDEGPLHVYYLERLIAAFGRPIR